MVRGLIHLPRLEGPATGQDAPGDAAPREIVAALGGAETFVMRIRQDGQMIEPKLETVIRSGATVVIAAHPQALLAAETVVGPEVDDLELLAVPTEKLDVVITNEQAANRTIKQLLDTELAKCGHGVFVRRIHALGPGSEWSRLTCNFKEGTY